MHSKNDVFSTDWSVKPPPPRARPSTSVISTEPASRREQELPSTTTDTSKVSTAGTDGLSSVPKIIEPPATPSVEPTEGLEVCLLSDSELGHGRHATVHLALYREHNEGRFRLGNDTSSAEQSTSDYIWKICAAKRFAPGKEAQMAGLSEALMLSRLAKCPQVIKYIGLKDDRPLSRPSSSRRSSSNDRFDEHGENHQPTDGDDSSPNRPSLSRSHSNNSISTPSSPFIKPIPNDSSIPALIGLQQRQQEENKTSLRRNATVKAPKPHFELSPKRRPLSISTNNIYDNPPRMLLLTDYCPLGNLAMFTLYHGERCLGERMFFKFAIDLMSALVAVHDKNIIHGDIKPQNCMIDTSFNLKLGDFSSSLFNSPDLDDGIGLGTTQYSSPEVVRMPPSPFSFPIDIFSAGLTLLFMITGIQPHEALTMASSNKPDRFTPKSHRSPHTTPGSSTPTSASSRRKYRSSSGAGKLVELHVHLSKGHAWEWEERRRLQDLEDEMIESYTEQISPSDSPPLIHNRTIHLREVNTSIDLTEEQSQAVKSVPAMVDVPESLLDPPTAQISRQAMQTYPDGHTPIQSFLNGGAVVPAPLRDLIRRMLEPRAANRPNSAQVLSDLKRLANWITLKD